jgi:NADH:ubiquinone oxidoreductase subunit 3 (subunit A)
LSLFIGYIFVVTLLVAAIIFWIGGKISPKTQPSEDKLLPYAGGERVEHELVPVSIRIFDYALLFIIFEVISLLLVFSLGPFEGTLDLISKVGVIMYVGIVSLAYYFFARRV